MRIAKGWAGSRKEEKSSRAVKKKGRRDGKGREVRMGKKHARWSYQPEQHRFIKERCKGAETDEGKQMLEER